MYPVGGDGLYLLLDEAGNFREDSFRAATVAVTAPAGRAAAAKLGSRESPDLQRLLSMLLERELVPAIVFTFSRKECEGAAMSARAAPMLPSQELAAVRSIFDAAVSTLSTADQQLKQIRMVTPPPGQGRHACRV